MDNRIGNSRRLTALLWFVIALVALVIGNGALAVTDPVESNYALTAKEMLAAGNWHSPQIYGSYWYDKPILTYWLLELSFAVGGLNEAAARFPAALAGALTVALVGRMAWDWTGLRTVGWYAAGFLLTAFAFQPISRSIITDAPLLLWTVITMGAAYRGIMEDSRRWMVIAYAAAGLACLTKGPVGLVLPGLILLVWTWWREGAARWRRLFDPVGIAAWAAVTFPWYGAMYALHGADFLMGFIGLHNITRATVSEHPSQNVWYYYLVILPLSVFPWTPLALREWWLVRRVRTPWITLCTAWIVTTVVFYTLMQTKYITYAYIAVVPLVILAAAGWDRIARTSARRTYAWLVVPVLVLQLLWAVAAGIFVPHPVPVYGIATAVVVLITAAWRSASAAGLAARAVVGLTLTTLVVMLTALPGYMDTRSGRTSAPALAAAPGDLYYYRCYATSVPFYIDRQPLLLLDEEITGAWAGKYTMPREYTDDIERRLAAGETLSVVVDSKLQEEFVREPYAAAFVPTAETELGTVYTTRRKD